MATRVQITVKGHLDTRWSEWFDNLTITNIANGESRLSGQLADQSALYSVLTKVRDLGLPLVSVATGEPDDSAGLHHDEGV